MKLSDRLELVVSFVQPGSRAADIGTDHGYIPIALVERGICPSAIASDIGKGPLKRAEDHIRLHGLEEKIQLRLGDGVSAVSPGEADTVIVSGMGGELIVHILDGGRSLWDTVRRWILSPQSEPDKLRLFLWRNGFCILREKMVRDAGKYYVVMDVARGPMDEPGPAEALYGPCLIRDRDPVLKEFLEREKQVCEDILKRLSDRGGEGCAVRSREIQKKLGRICGLLARW